jgi:lipopolysaccharide export LptBFGC system permease protein LptF
MQKLSFILIVAIVSFLFVFILYSNQQTEIVWDNNANSAQQSNTIQQNLDNNTTQQSNQETDQVAEKYLDIAVAYLLKSPTFAYDGMQETVTLANYQKISENEYIFKLRYYCKHPGYGNREDAPIPEQQTLHATLIRVENEKVTFAGTDNKYDEMTKQYMLFNPEIK